ncbi:protein disulfide isomerase family A, member 8 [Periophthalmus magnuspinnatus]|uniref:protein disulfide isomerase family A, member 8 n=1 Tax=Periophthalmus magnuspinnatus TaxID=409849 RepID=UPI0024363BD1|nr:protein disulfide isomerase family A, member 8 [Periophthalmus magnuspinnatus]
MALFLHFGFFLLLSFDTAGPARRDVLELADADFDYLATEHETMLVKFYAPWCGHCKKLAPDFEKAATKLKGTVQLAKVDCTANSELCARFGVTGYPSLKIFRSGRDAGPYDGPRSAEGIVQVMKKQSGPDSVLLRSNSDLEQFVNHYEASIVGLFSPDSSRLSEFLKAASLLREQFRFAHSSNLSLGQEYNATGECVLLFRPPRLSNKFEESVVVFSDYLTITSLRRFIRDNIFGLVPHLTVENMERLRVKDLLTVYYDLDYVHNVRGSNYWRNRVMLVASKFRGRGLSFSVANRKDFEAEIQEEFGLGPDPGLPVATIRTRLGLKYTMREEFTRDGRSLERFLEDYFSGRLKRFIKSEPVPEKNPGPVKVVVAESFAEIVDDPNKDALILFYSPLCQHCKKLEPVYAQLASELSSDPDVVVAKMNAADNDVPLGYDVQGFPTIYFAAIGRKDDPVRYEGPREVKDLLKFVKREASHSLRVKGSRSEL